MKKLCGSAALIALVLLPSARADSGGATISALPDSQQLEGHVEVQHRCGIEGCFWFGEAAQYPSSVECPLIYDGSHGIWVGPVEQGSGSSSGDLSFLPEAAVIRLCLYVNDEGTNLVGQSHPFNTQTGSEALPQPPRRQSSRATLKVRVFNGCKAHIYAIARGGGEEERGGRWSAEFQAPHKARLIPASNKQPWLWAAEGPPGDYRINMRFEGNATLLPSPPTTVTFHLRRCVG